MKTYLVSDVAIMFNVNEETIRRWIRDGKLDAKRGVGRSGHSITMEDIITFANKPPRAYLSSLETWLKSNNIDYEKIEDPDDKKTKAIAAGIVGATGAAAATTGTALAGTALTGAATAGITAAAGAATIGPILAVPALAVGAVKLAKRKNYQTYSIRISNPDHESPDNLETHNLEKEFPVRDFEKQQQDNAESIDTPNKSTTTLEEAITEQSDIPTTAPSISSLFDEITRAKQLLDAGIITPEEFSSIKAKLIARI